MTNGSATTKCRAKNPSTCTYHRADVFAGKVVEYLSYRVGFLSDSHSVPTGLAEDESVKAVIVDATRILNKKVVKQPSLLTKDASHQLTLAAQDAYAEAVSKTENGSESFMPKYYDYGNIPTAISMPFRSLVKPGPYDDTRNFLDPDVEAEPYEKATALMVADQGGFVSPNGSSYGWEDREATAHIRQCGVKTLGKPEETTWYEFTSTFDGNDTMHGVECTAECSCSLMKGQLRIQGDFNDMTRELVNKYAFKVAERYN